MEIDSPIGRLPQSFRDEKKQLIAAGITTWSKLKQLPSKKILELVREGPSTLRNLKRLKGMACLICELDLTPKDAALLLYSGLSTIKALADSTPQELINKTGRLQRQLKSDLPPVINLAQANFWIQKAKARQLKN